MRLAKLEAVAPPQRHRSCRPQPCAPLRLSAVRGVNECHNVVVLLPLPLLVMVLAATVVASAEEGNVTTIANTASQPFGVHIDPTTGVILFTQLHSLQRIHPNGTIETVVGSSASGSNDGIGAAAFFHTPWGVAVRLEDANLAYVADYSNHCLRHVDLATRSLTTFAGLCRTLGSDDGISTAARFHYPAGMALFHNTTSGVDVYLYVADRNNHVVRRVEIAIAKVTTLAGISGSFGAADGPRTTTAMFNYPDDVTVDATGGWVYVADTSNNCIRRVDASGEDGMVMTLAGTCGGGNSGFVDGTRDAARFFFPRGLTVDQTGDTLYVSDTKNCAIRRIKTTDGHVTTLSNRLGCNGSALVDGPLSTARFIGPYGIHYFDRNTTHTQHGHGDGEGCGLVIADANNFGARAVRRVVAVGGRGDVSAAPTGSHSLSSLSATAVSRRHSVSESARTATASWMASDTVTASTPSPHSPTRSVSARTTHSASRSSTFLVPTESYLATTSISALHSMASATLPSNNGSSTWSDGDASLTWSHTASDTSLACGTYDPRNVSLVAVTPGATVKAASVGRRMLSVSAVTVDGAGIPVRAPSFDPAQQPMQLSGAPLPRVALLTTHREDTPLLLVGLSLQWVGSARWGVVSAISVQHDDEALKFNATTSASSLTTAGSTLVDPFPNEIAVLLWPPPSSPNGWVAAGLEPVYTATEVVVELGLACTAEGGNTSGGRAATVRVVIPAPGHPRELAEQVETTATVAQWATAVGGPGAGTAVGRVAAVRSMSLCGGGDGASGGGLIGLRLACGDDPDTAHGSDTDSAARGAIAGNAGILCGSIALVLLLATLYCVATRCPFPKAALRFAMPSVLLPAWIATLPSTSAAAMELLLSTSAKDCAWDVPAAVLGLLVCVAPVAWICFVWLRLARVLGLHVVKMPAACPLSRRTPGARCLSGLHPAWVRAALHDALRMRMRWVSHEEVPVTPNAGERAVCVREVHLASRKRSTAASRNEPRVDGDDTRLDRARQAQVLLHEFRVLWYAALDAGVLVVSGALSAASGAGSRGLCVGAAASVCALYGLQLVVCAAARPFTTRFAFVHALMTLALSAASVGLQTAGIAEASGGGTGAASLERREMLTEASAVCDLFVVGISAVRVVLDVTDVCRAVASIVKEVWSARSGKIETPSKDASTPVVPEAPADQNVTVVPLDTLPSVGDDTDLLFWDAAGNAVQPQASDGEGLLAVTTTTTGCDPVDGNERVELPPLPLRVDVEADRNVQTQAQATPSDLVGDEVAAYAALQLLPDASANTVVP